MRFSALLVLNLFCMSAFGQAENPILRFHEVTPKIFRGARPDEAGIAALAKMGVKTIVDLENDMDDVEEEMRIASRYQIKVINVPMSGFWSPSDSEVDEALQNISNVENQPVFVHCLHGEDRTGLIVGLYRVFYQNWASAKAWHEMRALGFHRMLFFLKEYFETKTGFDD